MKRLLTITYLILAILPINSLKSDELFFKLYSVINTSDNKLDKGLKSLPIFGELISLDTIDNEFILVQKLSDNDFQLRLKNRIKKFNNLESIIDFEIKENKLKIDLKNLTIISNANEVVRKYKLEKIFDGETQNKNFKNIKNEYERKISEVKVLNSNLNIQIEEEKVKKSSIEKNFKELEEKNKKINVKLLNLGKEKDEIETKLKNLRSNFEKLKKEKEATVEKLVNSLANEKKIKKLENVKIAFEQLKFKFQDLNEEQKILISNNKKIQSELTDKTKTIQKLTTQISQLKTVNLSEKNISKLANKDKKIIENKATDMMKPKEIKQNKTNVKNKIKIGDLELDFKNFINKWSVFNSCSIFSDDKSLKQKMPENVLKQLKSMKLKDEEIDSLKTLFTNNVSISLKKEIDRIVESSGDICTKERQLKNPEKEFINLLKDKYDN